MPVPDGGGGGGAVTVVPGADQGDDAAGGAAATSGSDGVAVPQFGQNRSWPASVVPHCVQKPAIAPPLPMNGQADDSVTCR